MIICVKLRPLGRQINHQKIDRILCYSVLFRVIRRYFPLFDVISPLFGVMFPYFALFLTKQGPYYCQDNTRDSCVSRFSAFKY